MIPDQDPGLPPVPVQDPGVLNQGRGTIRVPSMVPGRLAPGTISGRGRGTRAMDPSPRNQSLINLVGKNIDSAQKYQFLYCLIEIVVTLFISILYL